MNRLLLAFLIGISTSAMGQIQPVHEKLVPIENLSDYEVLKDPENGQEVYRGIFSFREMQRDTSFSWLQQGMDAYTPNNKAMNYLHDHLHDYHIKVFLGTWCDDSHQVIPKFYKVIQGTGAMGMDNLVVGMDRDKKTKDLYMNQVSDFKITRLPTIILIDNEGKEAGRITESVEKSVEADLVKIIKADLKKK